ncbi:hypothetical protein [Nannocystis pusilla]|uniref:hypothetical protein n=1 Tax=Nannocystis pusilla TaxID=889268 RepID=UPI003B7BFE99
MIGGDPAHDRDPGQVAVGELRRRLAGAAADEAQELAFGPRRRPGHVGEEGLARGLTDRRDRGVDEVEQRPGRVARADHAVGREQLGEARRIVADRLQRLARVGPVHAIDLVTGVLRGAVGDRVLDHLRLALVGGQGRTDRAPQQAGQGRIAEAADRPPDLVAERALVQVRGRQQHLDDLVGARRLGADRRRRAQQRRLDHAVAVDRPQHLRHLARRQGQQVGEPVLRQLDPVVAVGLLPRQFEVPVAVRHVAADHREHRLVVGLAGGPRRQQLGPHRRPQRGRRGRQRARQRTEVAVRPVAQGRDHLRELVGGGRRRDRLAFDTWRIDPV